jgi:hypothetical protein
MKPMISFDLTENIPSTMVFHAPSYASAKPHRPGTPLLLAAGGFILKIYLTGLIVVTASTNPLLIRP